MALALYVFISHSWASVPSCDDETQSALRVISLCEKYRKAIEISFNGKVHLEPCYADMTSPKEQLKPECKNEECTITAALTGEK